jgi:antitoxin MazE
MTTVEVVHPVKIIAIGNSRGVRLPQALLRRYAMVGQIVLEERPDGLLLRGQAPGALSLRQTFAEMAKEQAAGSDDWRDLDALAGDGLGSVKW